MMQGQDDGTFPRPHGFRKLPPLMQMALLAPKPVCCQGVGTP